MQQSVSAHAPPASLPAAEPWWPHGWWKIMDMRLGIIPLPIYIVLCALLAGFTYTGSIKGEVSVMIAVLVIGGFTCAEIGKRLPILRNIGAGAIFATFIPSALVYYKLLPDADREVDHRLHQVHQLPLPVHRLHHRRLHPGHGPPGPDQGLPEDLRAARARLDRGGPRRHAGRHAAGPGRLPHLLLHRRADHGRRRRRGRDPALDRLRGDPATSRRATCSRRCCRR